MNRSPGVACGSQTAGKPSALAVYGLVLANIFEILFQKEEMCWQLAALEDLCCEQR